MGYEMCRLEFCHLSRFGSQWCRDLLLFIKCLDLAVAPVPRSCYTGVNNGGGLPSALPRPFCTFCLGQYVWKYSFEIGCKEQAACQSQVCRFWSVGFFCCHLVLFCFGGGFCGGGGVLLLSSQRMLYFWFLLLILKGKHLLTQPTKKGNPFMRC